VVLDDVLLGDQRQEERVVWVPEAGDALADAGVVVAKGAVAEVAYELLRGLVKVANRWIASYSAGVPPNRLALLTAW
jgi:hypothetical protein